MASITRKNAEASHTVADMTTEAVARLLAIVEDGIVPVSHAAPKRVGRKASAARVLELLKDRSSKGIPLTDAEDSAAQGTGTFGAL